MRDPNHGSGKTTGGKQQNTSPDVSTDATTERTSPIPNFSSIEEIQSDDHRPLVGISTIKPSFQRGLRRTPDELEQKGSSQTPSDRQHLQPQRLLGSGDEAGGPAQTKPSYFQYLEPQSTPCVAEDTEPFEVDLPAPLPLPPAPQPQTQRQPGAYASVGGVVAGDLRLRDRAYYTGATTSSGDDNGATIDATGLHGQLDPDNQGPNNNITGTNVASDAQGPHPPEARLVQDEEDPKQAEEVSPATLAERAANDKKRKMKERIVLGLFVLLVAIAFSVILGAIFGQPEKDDEQQQRSPPTITPFLAPSNEPSSTPSTSLEMLVENFPEYTLENLMNSSTPQWKAMDWLSKHPELPSMEEKRKRRLFALATFYYSMDGDDWLKPVRDRWMLYSDECLWHSSEFGFFYQLNGEHAWEDEYYGLYEYRQWERGFAGYPPCNQDNTEFQVLNLQTRENFIVPPLPNPLIPPEITLLTSLSVISFVSNGLNTSINDFFPSQFCYQMTNMKVLWMHRNLLTGSISREWGLLTNVEEINLEQNSLTGPIPSQLGSMTKMTRLSLDDNNLTGEIPTELGLMTNLESLRLWGNSLAGSIPSQLAKLSSLWALRLRDNDLTGTVPQQLEALVTNGSLRALSLTNNSLSGTIPEALCSLGVYDDRSSPIMSGWFRGRFGLGLSFDCNERLCGCCWCPCPASNYSSTTDQCETDQDQKFTEDKGWPGAFPVQANNGSDSIMVNIRSDDFPVQTTFDWSILDKESGLWNMSLSEGLPAEGRNVVHSYPLPIDSEALYRLQLYDDFGDGICCWYSLGWFTMTSSIPSEDYANGTVVWGSTGFDLQFLLVVYIWVDSNGIARQVEHIPGEGHALVQGDDGSTSSSGQDHPVVIVLADVAMNNDTSVGNNGERNVNDDDLVNNASSTVEKVGVEDGEP